MNDTLPSMADKFQSLMREKSGVERLAMGCSMFDTCKILVSKSIFEQHPNADQRILQREIFLRFYGMDFDVTTSDRIIASLVKGAR